MLDVDTFSRVMFNVFLRVMGPVRHVHVTLLLGLLIIWLPSAIKMSMLLHLNWSYFQLKTPLMTWHSVSGQSRLEPLTYCDIAISSLVLQHGAALRANYNWRNKFTCMPQMKSDIYFTKADTAQRYISSVLRFIASNSSLSRLEPRLNV